MLGYKELLHQSADNMDDENPQDQLNYLDYFVFSLTLVIALGVGVYQMLAGGGQKTTSQYLMGNRQLSPFPVALSIFMSVVSGILVLGTSAEMYIYGTQLWFDPLAQGLMYAVSARLFVPMMYKLRVTSVFEYHSRRYNSEVLHMMCLTISIIYSLTYMGIAMYAPATALEGVTGFPIWASLLCTGVVAVIYTTIGGMKAVIYTDFFQGFVLFAGLLIVLIFGCIEVGGLDRVWEISKEGGRINFFNMNPDPTQRTSFWTVFFGSGMMALTQSANEQTQVQRYSTLPSVRDATLVVLMQIPLLLACYTLICLCGLTAYAYYDMTGCDPYRGRIVSSTNQLLPYFVYDAIAIKGLTGLFISVLFSGALSSISSSMNALAAITYKDILEKHLKEFTELRKTVITKVTALIFGAIGVLLGFAMQFFDGNIMQLSFTLLTGLNAPLAGVIIAGAIFPWVQATGMIIGLIAGCFIFLWITIGQFIHYPHATYLNTTVENCTFANENITAVEIPEDPDDVMWLYTLSFQYIPLSSLLTTIFVGLLASLLTGKRDPRTADPMTQVDLGKQCGCCYPASCQEGCRCGVPFHETEQDWEEQEIVKSNGDIVKSNKEIYQYGNYVECIDEAHSEKEALERNGDIHNKQDLRLEQEVSYIAKYSETTTL